MPSDNEESGFAQGVLPRRAGQVFWGTGVATLGELRGIAYESRRNMQCIFVKEVPGVYFHDQNSTDTEDSPYIIEPTDGLGRWLLLVGSSTGASSSSIQFYKGAVAPSAPIEGDIWYDTVNKQWRGYSGTDWSTILG